MVQRNIKNIDRFNEIKRKINLARDCIFVYINVSTSDFLV